MLSSQSLAKEEVASLSASIRSVRSGSADLPAIGMAEDSSSDPTAL